MVKQFEPSHTLQRLPEQFFAQLVKKAQKLKEAGHDVINLGQGNPDLPTPDAIVDKLQEAAARPKHHKYPPFRGQPFLKQAVCDFYQREYGVMLDPETEVAVLPGAKTGLVELSQCLLNPGDKALLPDPGYPDYMSGIALADATPLFMPLRAENSFLPDYAALNGEDKQAAKLMFLNYPNNPTAGTASASFFEETTAFAQKHDICVCHDFAYGAIGFDGEKPRSFLQTEGAKDIGIEIYTLSKSYNMAGWRIAFAVGNPSVIESINLLQDHMYVSVFGAVQEAATEALQGSQENVKELVAVYEQRRNTLVSSLRDIGWDVPSPKGSFFAWLPVPAGFRSEEFADLLLEKAHVVVAPGTGFGKSGDGYVRVGLVAPEELMKEAAARIGKLGLF
ncbi:pyridoxal phosphate-dependent aminotransferase [Alkalicoccus daliensis]|uniref:Aminotransferase n=1 Tax=Alkalicoccus daliensis TaxID=745820 RepID=A0A1H0EWZ4_9BACI|nr:pyridoxal phosphate-dependent aminotransferase [Alkalicoccus daliensis]SDN86957.1 aminotransferase [Alkalicoccus daliensis]